MVYRQGLCRVRVPHMCGICKFMVVFLEVEMAVPQFSIYRKTEYAYLLFCMLPVHDIYCAGTERPGPAHLGVIRDMFSSSSVSDASCMRVVGCADGTSCHACAVCVCTLYIVSKQGIGD